jgi:hypothetical protein
MHTPEHLRIHPILAALGILASCAAIVGVAGCNNPAGDRIVVATIWPLAERRQVEADFRAWKGAAQNQPFREVRIDWLVLDERSDLSKLADRTEVADVLLGGSPAVHARLAKADRIRADQPAAEAHQVLVERARERLLARLGDPRTDPSTLAFAVGRLDRGRWPKGYAELVRLAGARDTGREPVAVMTECASVLHSSRSVSLAGKFLRFLAESRPSADATVAAHTPPDAIDPLVESLIADLLGAALIDARDELETGWAALERAGLPGPALKWMTEPPSWPPASVTQYLSRKGQAAMSLVETLAHELAPDPAARAWLVRSWLAPARVVDDTLLGEIAQAADGRLGREPRFRAWMSAEWTASARQRYRRVARLAQAARSDETNGAIKGHGSD